MDLDWEYKRAGEYETFWYRNGYRYRIEKDDSQSNCWHAYYKWDKWTKKSPLYGQWRVLPGGPWKTKKEAQQDCARHNKSPREKWVFDGFVTPEEIQDSSTYYFEHKLKRLGYAKFKRANGWSHNNRYLNPKFLGLEDPDPRNEELIRKFIAIRGKDSRFSRNPEIVKLVREFDGTIPVRDEGQREEDLDRLSVQPTS